MSRARNGVRQVDNFILNEDNITIIDFSFCLRPQRCSAWHHLRAQIEKVS